MADAAQPRPAPRRGRLRTALFAVVAVVLGLALVEGLASLGLFAYDVIFETERVVPTRRHTLHDADLGWINEPGIVVRDLYGPGRTLTINDQGFRNASSFASETPPGVTRVLCSGDSFTLGYGVGDADTWCARWAEAAPNVEVVNMGQSGYGLDQVILWYQRDGVALDHDLHVVAIGTQQFMRMRRDRFLGYAKPTIKLEGGRIVADNVPVPRTSFRLPWVTQNIEILRSARIVELLTRLRGAAPAGPAVLTLQEATQLALDGLYLMHQDDLARGSRLAVVWLPTRADCDERGRGYRQQFLEVLRARDVVTLDLTEAFQALPPEAIDGMFIGPGEVAYVGAEGHYSVEGNRFVAERLAAQLGAMPALRPILGGP